VNSGPGGALVGAPRLILRLEGVALCFGAAFFYWRLDGSWIVFAVLFLAPDLSFLAYLVSPRFGAIAYNAAYATLGPLAMLVLGAAFGSAVTEHIGLIWLVHAGFDRALG
jgi:hypothetical protein